MDLEYGLQLVRTRTPSTSNAQQHSGGLEHVVGITPILRMDISGWFCYLLTEPSADNS